ncbi:MAG: hypothetical protein OES09_12560 [Gammaproteobacteria bacterium]|nr:hypothetical protein [Gammaproteobacteria bacterium]
MDKIALSDLRSAEELSASLVREQCSRDLSTRADGLDDGPATEGRRAQIRPLGAHARFDLRRGWAALFATETAVATDKLDLSTV